MEYPATLTQLILGVVWLVAGGLINHFFGRIRSKDIETELDQANDKVRNLAAALACREGRLLKRPDYATQAEIDRLINEAKSSCGIERTVLLFACNGYKKPTEVSSLGVRNDKAFEDEYYRRPLDKSYQDLLDEMRIRGHAVTSTEELPADSLLGGIYRDIGAKHSLLTHLFTYSNDDLGIRGYVFMSWVKFTDSPFTDSEIRKCEAVANYKGQKLKQAQII